MLSNCLEGDRLNAMQNTAQDNETGQEFIVLKVTDVRDVFNKENHRNKQRQEMFWTACGKVWEGHICEQGHCPSERRYIH
jgi:hypothetical protein